MEKTKRGQKIVIDTTGYSAIEGFAAQMTLPSGKYAYAGSGSMIEKIAKERGLECKTIRYYGACIYATINENAHKGCPIQIDEESVAGFIDKIATKEEFQEYFKW